MTLSSHPNAHRTPRAFTLVEMLVVIGIIVLLIGILMPAINRAYRNAVRTRMAADLQTIVTALEAYRQDFADYPRDMTDIRKNPGKPFSLDYGTAGSRLLCWALIAPGDHTEDGADGPGFRLRGIQGTVHQAYIQPGQLKVAPDASLTGGIVKDHTSFIADRYGKPILYFPTSLVGDPTVHYADNNAQSYINPADNLEAFDQPLDAGNAALRLKRLRLQLGDTNTNGVQNPGERRVTAPYILWSAGPDSLFGPTIIAGDSQSEQIRKTSICDDVMNVTP